MNEEFAELCLAALLGPGSNFRICGGDAARVVDAVMALPSWAVREEDLTEETAARFADAVFCEDFSLLPERLSLL